MPPLNLNEVVRFIENNIGEFHERRDASLQTLKLVEVLKNKNPYLFKAKNINDAHDLVKLLLDAHLSSQEETIFGNFLERLAIFVCGMVYRGRKSAAEGIDLEFTRDSVLYIVSVKSGPNWGNSSQIKRLAENFRQAKRILRMGNSQLNVQAINGCCYGRVAKPDKGDYLKICGQEFWELISANDRLFVDIVEPLGYQAKERTEQFLVEYARVLNLFTLEFTNEFCVEGRIDWEKLVRLNSGKKEKKPRKTAQKKRKA
ncbi:MAG: cytosolic protein [Anaerolineae bacterium]|nr:MAG: cytosolic protein [Anaerolineae bacterium]WKZ44304.1 MAG: PmeII family type II restriction endonuclease [Anaerolineales bacterium]